MAKEIKATGHFRWIYRVTQMVGSVFISQFQQLSIEIETVVSELLSNTPG